MWLASLGWQVTGLDFSGVALERARSLALDRGLEVSWAQEDLTTWHGEAEMDLVLVAYMQVPPPDRQRSCARPGLPHRAAGCSWSGTTCATSSTAPAARRTRRCSASPRSFQPTVGRSCGRRLPPARSVSSSPGTPWCTCADLPEPARSAQVGPTERARCSTLRTAARTSVTSISIACSPTVTSKRLHAGFVVLREYR